MEEKTDLDKKLVILFWGNFIPLQGIQYVVKAAKILEQHQDVEFKIIGNGQTYPEIMGLVKSLDVKNIFFVNKMTQEEIVNHIRSSDVCLGIFGDTDKTQRVIPNKVYEAIAMKKAVISGDTPAIRELFRDRENILLCKVADSDDLAVKILELKEDPDLRGSIALKGYELFKKFATPQKIGRQLLRNLKLD